MLERSSPVLFLGVACSLLIGMLGAAPSLAGTLDFEVVRVASGLVRPVYATAPPGDRERIFIVGQHGGTGLQNRGKPGRILILDLASGSINETPFLEVNGVNNGNPQGLLCLAFHPDYASNGHFYVTYTADGKAFVTRFEVSADPDVADPESETRVMSFAQPDSTHNTGWIGFGPDGYLYIGSGDGGTGWDTGDGHSEPMGNAQDTLVGNVLGKILRVDVDNDDFPGSDLINYAVPSDNPFVGVFLAEERIWVYGVRNPWRASFDRATGDLWFGDVGQNDREEINYQPGDSSGGENYGWRLREGTIQTPMRLDGLDVGGPQPEDGVNPILDYTQEEGRCSVTGGYVYRGPVPSIQGKYFFADHCTGKICSLLFDGSDPADFDGTNYTDRYDWTEDPGFAPDAGSIGRVTSFGEDDAGNLYIVDLDGEVFRIQPVPEPAALLTGASTILCRAAPAAGSPPEPSVHPLPATMNGPSFGGFQWRQPSLGSSPFQSLPRS